MVKGGTHPRGKSNVVVSPLNADFDTSLQQAVDLAYYANVACLTPWSTFQDARYCMKLFAPGGAGDTVDAAWEAVGVRPIVKLLDGVPLPNQALSEGGYQEYAFVTGRGIGYYCETTGTTGDADLYARRYSTPDPFLFASLTNDCTSVSNPESNEVCNGLDTPTNTPVSVVLKASETYTDVTLTCATICQGVGDPCYSKADCCSKAGPGSNAAPLTCDGTNESNRICKKCKSRNKACRRKSECCSNKCNTNGKCSA